MHVYKIGKLVSDDLTLPFRHSQTSQCHCFLRDKKTVVLPLLFLNQQILLVIVGAGVYVSHISYGCFPLSYAFV